MKIKIERASLLKALTRVQSVVEKRTTTPILSNARLEARGDWLNLTATDMELEMVDAAPAEVLQEGAITAPAHTLFEIIRKLPEGAEVELATNPANQRLMISSGRSKFQLATIGVDQYPAIIDERFPAQFTLPGHALTRLFAKTRFAVSTEETRFYLNGIFLHVANGTDGKLLRTVATDGHRLALAEMAAPEGAEAMPAVIVPRKTIQEVMRLASEAEDGVTVSVSESRIRFVVGKTALTSKLIDGSFPDYGRVIPRDNQRHLKIDNRALADAVDRVATVSQDRARSVKMALEDGRVTVTVNHPETGLATEEIFGETPAGTFEVGFNARYLMDVTDQIEGVETQFEFGDSGSPALVRDPADPSSLFVLMPLRV